MYFGPETIKKFRTIITTEVKNVKAVIDSIRYNTSGNAPPQSL